LEAAGHRVGLPSEEHFQTLVTKLLVWKYNREDMRLYNGARSIAECIPMSIARTHITISRESERFPRERRKGCYGYFGGGETRHELGQIGWKGPLVARFFMLS
jgi:hypothetical protein